MLGFYYLSENSNFEATLNLPINGDVNYKANKTISVGVGFQAPVRSYTLFSEDGQQPLYVQANLIDVALYLQYNFLNRSLIFRLMGGYTSQSYEVFNKNDKLPIRLSAFEFGDDRSLLNPEMNGNLFAQVQLTYHFPLNK